MRKLLMLLLVSVLIIFAVGIVVRHKNLPAPMSETALGSVLIKDSSGTKSYTIISSGMERTFLVHVPIMYSPSKMYPLVFVFHGGNGDGAKVLEQTSFEEKADSEGFIVIAPDGIEHNWNDGRGTTNAELAGVNDVALVRILLEQAENDLSIDTDRVYATGVSNGGMFSERLGCELSDILAAIGPVVGPMPQAIVKTCNPEAVSVIGIQGTVDPFMPLEGGDTKHKKLNIGDGGLVISAQATMQKWAQVNGCGLVIPLIITEKPRVEDGTTVTKYIYMNCVNSTAVEYYIVDGMGHGWPPVGRESVAGPTSSNINATDVVWNFFKAHPKISN